jgi:hypothetical protein
VRHAECGEYTHAERTSSGADRRVRGGRLQAARGKAKAGPYVPPYIVFVGIVK